MAGLTWSLRGAVGTLRPGGECQVRDNGVWVCTVLCVNRCSCLHSLQGLVPNDGINLWAAPQDLMSLNVCAPGNGPHAEWLVVTKKNKKLEQIHNIKPHKYVVKAFSYVNFRLKLGSIRITECNINVLCLYVDETARGFQISKYIHIFGKCHCV